MARLKKKALKDNASGIEVYGSGRYLTVTGRQMESTPCEIRQAPRTLSKLTAVVEAARGPKRAKPSGKVDAGADFWCNVNTTALANLDAWVPALHPTARKQATGAWRITSKDLGRGLEEDLSYHPEGIRDHGEEHGLTPISAFPAKDGWPIVGNSFAALRDPVGHVEAMYRKYGTGLSQPPIRRPDRLNAGARSQRTRVVSPR